jgi:hypothetical protein
MAKTVPVGYVDFVLNILRAGDPDPYAVTFGAKIDGGPFTALHLDAIAATTGTMLDQETQPEDTLVGLTAYVANDGPPFIYEQEMSTVGTSPGDCASQNCALIITKNTGLGGRWNKGRMFWPSVNEAAITPVGALAGAYRTGTETAFNLWRTEITGLPGTYGISELSLFHDESLGILPTPITSFVVEPVIGTQRRRLRR